MTRHGLQHHCAEASASWLREPHVAERFGRAHHASRSTEPALGGPQRPSKNSRHGPELSWCQSDDRQLGRKHQIPIMR